MLLRGHGGDGGATAILVRCHGGDGGAAATPLWIGPTRSGTAEVLNMLKVSAVPRRRSAVLTVFGGATAINDGTTAEPRRSWRCHCGVCRTSTAVAPGLRCDEVLMEPCRTSHVLHLVSHRAQFWDLYSSCCTSTTSTKTFNRVSASLQMIALYIVLKTNTTHDTPVKFHDLFLCIVFAFHSPEDAQHQYSTIQYKSDRWNHRFSRSHSNL